MARRPGDNQTPAPDARGRPQPYPRIKPDLHRATSRGDPLPADVVHDYGDDGRNLDTPTSRIPPGSGDVFGAGAGPRDDARADPVTVTVHIVPLVQGRRFRHHQPYTTGQRGPHR
jgi:hypothetical protein